jgi:phosphoglycerate dehydrogenase-like enzyme
MRVAVLDDYQGVALSMADWAGVRASADVTTFRDHVSDPESLTQRLLPYDVVVLMRERTPLPGVVIERLPNLKLIVTTGRRNPVIDVESARRRGIPVCNTSSPGNSTSELTWALILGLSRHLVAEATSMRTGGWQATIGATLAGRTLGILGLGRIGAAVATIGRAFGMDVLGWSRSLTQERAAAAGATAVAFEQLLAQSDVVTIHLVLSDETRGLVGERELALMKPNALLINTSRGPIVDTAALIRALESGRLGGAGLDVYDEEPLPPDHPLRSAPRTLLTPHIGYVTDSVYRVFFTEAVENIEAFLAGRPIRVI